ncbi:hypothetical protein FGO68_gene8692 [Halteria grandinella]|uniref:Glucosidase II subunit alpha n=1 Tax=Halteria grandinella TaxID=5974 RepID=A0A8J8T6I8_HALGN|nr:hypothetical protein FGO68_gene8692 [Halteria grandinella]
MSGPQALSLDVSYPFGTDLYGIPERINSFNLKDTDTLGEPYRLYNTDHFDDTYPQHTLYGSIPMVQSRLDQDSFTTGFFWANSSDSFVDIITQPSTRSVHWMSESGALEFYILPAGTPQMFAYKQFLLTGQMPMPPLFSLGYHQCRWNYMTELETLEVSENMKKHQIPCDAIWLDIEYTQDKKYFTVDNQTFGMAAKMLDKLVQDGRKLVTIIDPHIKKDEDYFVYKELMEKKLIILDSSGERPYEGWCWPRQSVWVDFMNPVAREYLSSLYVQRPAVVDKGQIEANYIFSDPNVHIWNDMNEPACFDPFEKSMAKSNLHNFGESQQIEHRDVHNLYGLYNTMATYDGLLKRTGGTDRPFILTRSFFAGSQKYAAMWSGDCRADYAHFNLGIPILLQSSICGLTFIGSDVPGFFNDPPSDEFVVRTYQIGSLFPFFRAHAHHDAKRREPWTFGPDICDKIRASIQLRYKLLPYLYTAFYQSHLMGEPIMRPMWYSFPTAAGANSIETQFMLGDSILACPILTPESAKVQVFAPQEANWYNFFTQKIIEQSDSNFINLEITLDTFGLLLKEGSIIPTFSNSMDHVRSTEDLRDGKSKYDLHVYPRKQDGWARGYLYIDDGKTLAYKEQGEYILVRFDANSKTQEVQHHIIHFGIPSLNKERFFETFINQVFFI